MDAIQNYNGFNIEGIDLKSSMNDFLKDQYTEGIRNEFANSPALLNSFKKDTITGKKKYKAFALGVADNVRALGGIGIQQDMYQIHPEDFMQGGDTVDAEFDTTKLIGIFSVTDETLMLSESPEAFTDVVKSNLDKMQLGLTHTNNRMAYGSYTGHIGHITNVKLFEDKVNSSPGKMMGNKLIQNDLLSIKCTNSHSFLPGMGIMLRVLKKNGENFDAKYRQGKIWQTDTSSITTTESLIICLDPLKDGQATKEEIAMAIEDINALAEDTRFVEIYARQLIDGEIGREYHGLEDIVINNESKIFGVDRSVYTSLKCIKHDMQNELLTESILRDMVDAIVMNSPDNAIPGLVCSKHKIVSSIEKQMYQFKQYSMDGGNNGFELGRPNIKFDGLELKKDKYSRDNNVYILDCSKISELVRKEFGFITAGRNQVLERRDGTEIYEAIMTKHADTSIDAWKAHASFVNVKDSVI